MSSWQGVTLTCAVLFAVQAGSGAAASAPSDPSSGTKAAAAASVLQARPALRYDPATRCPDLLRAAAADQPAAVVLFRVGPTGVPSQASVKSSSGSEALDAAATSCVLRLRYFPVLAAGDGTAVESWQQMAFGWRKAEPQPVAHREPSATAPAAEAKGNDASARSSLAAASANAPSPREGTAAVRVCIDETGKVAQTPTILQSAGDRAFDKAAIDIVTSGHYPPAMKNGKAAADCFRVTVGFEVK